MTSPTPTRWLLSLLATVQLAVGGSALLAPSSFYVSFPWFRDRWISAYGPFNEHLVVDAGAGFLATGLALAIAACWLQRPIIIVALVTYLAQALPHVIYHLGSPGPGLPLPDQVANVVGLAGGVVVAGLLLLAWLRSEDRNGSGEAPSPRRGHARPGAAGQHNPHSPDGGS